jgi:NSS family neurotransmitter:Na+ symporter
MERVRWSSRIIFIFAAVGSAVGLGNVWRFPYLAGKYGGGAFLIPYVIMLVIMGIPLLIMEFAIGQRMQLGASGSFGKIKHMLSSIGFGAVLCGFVVVSYYAVIMAWSLLYFKHSFTLAWADQPAKFFTENVINLSDSPLNASSIITSILVGLIIVWFLIYFSIWKGIKSVSKVVTLTMPLPILLLVVLVIRGITLPGAYDGIIYYLRPNWQALIDFEVWSAAMSQIFFTLSLAFGIMIAYASYQHHKSDIAKNAVMTSIINSCISIVAGFAVFATLGYMSMQQNIPLDKLAASGPKLAFIVFPEVLSLIPGAPIFAALFFLMLLTLGIDSAFSLVEAVTTVVSDQYPQLRREDVALYVCVFGFLSGVVFTTAAGLYYLDIVDHFITNYGLVFVGLLEALAVGWVYGAEKLRNYINEVSEIKIGRWWNAAIRWIIPVLLVVLLITSLARDIKTPYENYPESIVFFLGWGMLALVLVISYLLAHFSRPRKALK